MNYTKRLLSGMRHGEKGMTLIELLVVIAILGIIAAIVLLNVGDFMGSGAKEGANTEAHQVQTASIAYLVANSMTSYATTLEIGPNTDTVGSGVGDLVEAAYLMGGPLQATYTIATDGAITSAVAVSGGKWGTLAWTSGGGWQ
jgi:type IV pilus assembly protein PilA